MATTVRVKSEHPYDVNIGTDLWFQIAAEIPAAAERVLIVHTAELTERSLALQAVIDQTGRITVRAEVPDAEEGKVAGVLAFCWEVMGKSDFTRSDVVIGLGGGAVTDLAGFVAATWLRGVNLIQVPTTLLAMVDAAVGGKTGINTPEGKNLVGAFHEPLAVWCDLDALVELPPNHFSAGLAEIIKCGLIRDGAILDLFEDHGGAVRAADGALVEELIARAVQVKADVVAADLKESHLREILNYGHTFGHAIEYTERYMWRHGAAVSVGMVYAAELARLAGKLDDAAVDRHRSLLAAQELPTSYVAGRWDALFTAMRRDKKTRGTLLRFVILQGIGNPVRLEGPDPALLMAAYDAVSS